MFLIEPKAVEPAGHSEHVENHRMHDATDGEHAEDAIGGQQVVEDARHERSFAHRATALRRISLVDAPRPSLADNSAEQ